MGGPIRIVLESKAFVLMEEGGFVLITERSWKVMKEIRLGKVMVQCFIRTLGESLRSGMKELYATTREGDRSFIAQRCLNARGRFVALVEYGGGGRCNFIFISKDISEDVEGRGWRRLAVALREIILEEK